MKTVVFFSRLYYPHIGGVEKHVAEVSKKLIEKKYTVTVITERVSEEPVKEIINGVRVYRIDPGKNDRFKKFRIWKNIWKLRAIIKKSDIIHCHDVFFWYFPFRFIYPQNPVYTTFHGYESYPIKKKAIIVRKISEKLSWGNICIGDFIKKWYGTKPTFVSYGAVERSKIKDQSSKIKKHSALFIGRLDEQTGVLTYAKSVGMIRKKIPNFDFLVVGDGEYKKMIDKKVHLLGFQNNPEKYYEHYHFAFVSRYLSILEAFAAKRLVFAVYDNPVKEDYLKMAPYAPFIIIENTPEKLAQKVEEILKNPKIEEKKVNDAFDWMKKQTWEEMTKLYIKLWEKKY